MAREQERAAEAERLRQERGLASGGVCVVVGIVWLPW